MRYYYNYSALAVNSEGDYVLNETNKLPLTIKEMIKIDGDDSSGDQSGQGGGSTPRGTNMQRITITEKDTTTNGSEYTLADSVFIPGFANTGDILKPIKCSTVAEFQQTFCADGNMPVFKEAQNYPEFKLGNTAGFAENAIPPHQDEEDASIMYLAGETCPSYKLAIKLLSNGISIYYMRMNSQSYTVGSGGEIVFPSNYDVTVAKAYEIFKSEVFIETTVQKDSITEKYYDIKYLTTGGYPSFEYSYTDGSLLANLMTNIAAVRGDCVALIDHTDNSSRALTGSTSVYESVKSSGITNGTYGTMFTPWAVDATGTALQPSYIYLANMAQSSKTNPTWLAISGVSRGLLTNVAKLNTDKDLTNTIAESYQNSTGISINPITYIRPYGYCIWGNRTLTSRGVSNTATGFATSFLNLRNLVSDVKKQAYLSAQSCLFEQNTDVLWTNFKSLMTPLLDQMVSGTGLKAYKLIKNSTVDKTKISCTIKIYPIYAVESFDIVVHISNDDDVEVSE